MAKRRRVESIRILSRFDDRADTKRKITHVPSILQKFDMGAMNYDSTFRISAVIIEVRSIFVQYDTNFASKMAIFPPS